MLEIAEVKLTVTQFRLWGRIAHTLRRVPVTYNGLQGQVTDHKIYVQGQNRHVAREADIIILDHTRQAFKELLTDDVTRACLLGIDKKKTLLSIMDGVTLSGARRLSVRYYKQRSVRSCWDTLRSG